MQDNDRLDLQLFARRGGRNYMMRSEKRPGYNRPAQKPRPRRRRRNVGYIVLTLIVAILLWPVGLFLIWNRRLRCGVGGKLLWSVATLAVFCGLIIALLTVPTGNAEFQRFQDNANDFIETVGADASIAWETFTERAGDAFGNMRSVGCSLGNYALNKAADGIEGGVEIGRDVRAWVSGLLPATDEQEPAVEGEETQAPDDSEAADEAADEASAAPDASSAPTPDASNAPTPTAAYELPSDEQLREAQLMTAGMALSEGVLDEEGDEEPAPEQTPEQTPYPTPTPRGGVAPQSVEEEATQEPDANAAEETVAPSATPEAEDAPDASPAAEASETPAAPRATPQPAMAMPTPTPAPETADGAVTAKNAGEFTVYHTENGRYYHMSADCSDMVGAQEDTLTAAVEGGFEPCPECGAPAAELVDAEDAVWVDEDDVYHVSDECASFAGEARLMSAAEAAEAECVPCAACGANALSASEEAASEEELLEQAKEVTVYFYDGSRAYHAENTCVGMSGAPERTLYEAIEMDKPPCSRCDPPTLESLE